MAKKSFRTDEAFASIATAINLVAAEMEKPKEQQNEKRAGQVALAAVKVIVDSEAASMNSDKFDLAPIAEIEGKIEQAVGTIEPPPLTF